jgi:hypothetical protein
MARIGTNSATKKKEKFKIQKHDANGTLTTASIGLFALMLAFTFSLASSKFENRRAIIVEESNNIGTAILRVNLYHDSLQVKMKELFRKYLQARIDYYQANENSEEINIQLKKSSDYSNQLWQIVADASKNKEYSVASMQMIPALNSMIDVVTTRHSIVEARVPEGIFFVLIFMAIICSYFIGYTTLSPISFDWGIVIGFGLLTSVIIYLTLDLDRPRSGLITVDHAEQSIIDLKQILIKK